MLGLDGGCGNGIDLNSKSSFCAKCESWRNGIADLFLRVNAPGLRVVDK
jgi:hypothetical protein